MTTAAAALAAAAPVGDVPAVLLALVAVFVATKVLGEAAQRLGQPGVLGELIAGVILGGSVLGVLDPRDPVIHVLGELGVIVLLFEIGLHTDLSSLLRVGSSAVAVAVVGVVLPFAGGFGVATALGLSTVPALVCGAALTATSIGISARVLSDLGRLETPEGRIVLGAAVLDDVIGLIILSVIAGIVGGAGVSVAGVTWTTAVALGFVAAALVVGGFLAPPLFRVVEGVRTAGALGVAALAFAFGLAWLAARTGSAMIVGAFAAGLVLNRTPQRAEIERATTAIGHFFVPIFFAAVGAAVDLRAVADPRALTVGAALTAVGIAGKVAAGWAPIWFRGHKLLIGVAMVPRGEVGLIFAQMGLTTGAIDAGLFGALMLMVLTTTFVTPPALARVGRAQAPQNLASQPGDGGIDDLVVGTRRD
ncbi:MAG TPA: cation:proton antiporter [Gemmatimonadaceae bacterium]|nr:cation:proton antiporter [Gemmatimonadaceae bacterium]